MGTKQSRITPASLSRRCKKRIFASISFTLRIWKGYVKRVIWLSHWPVPFENEIRVLGKDGNYRAFLFRYKPVLDQAGKIDQWYMAALEIDDRKRVEAQVEQSYLRLAEAQRLSKTGSFITDLVADEHNWSEGDLPHLRLRSRDQGHGAEDSGYHPP